MMNVFPTLIEAYKLTNIDNDSLVNYAYSLKNKSDGRIASNKGGFHSDDLDYGRVVSNKGGYQSNDLDFNNISGLMVEILKHISAYCGKLNLKKNTTINYTNAWFNVNGQHDYNMNHTHNGFISGVYYLQAHPQMGEIVFYNSDKLKDILWHGEYFENYNEYNNTSFMIKPITGLLVLFPAWLEHGVEMNGTTDDRISLSFNTKIEYVAT